MLKSNGVCFGNVMGITDGDFEGSVVLSKYERGDKGALKARYEIRL